MLPHTKANLKKLRVFAEKRHSLIKETLRERDRINCLESQLNRHRLTSPSPDPDVIADLTKQIQSLETHIDRLERDVVLCIQDQEYYLQELFGDYHAVQRNRDSTDIYFGGYKYVTSDHSTHGDGIGHGHALLFLDGSIIIFREPLDPNTPLNDALSGYRYVQQLRTKSRSKKFRQQFHKSRKK